MQTLINWVPVTQICPENKNLYRAIVKLYNRSEFETICAYNVDWDEYVDEINGKMYSPYEIRLIAQYQPPHTPEDVPHYNLEQSYWAEKKRAELAENRLIAVNKDDSECWAWIDTDNYLDSLPDSRVVKIRADDLRKLLVKGTQKSTT